MYDNYTHKLRCEMLYGDIVFALYTLRDMANDPNAHKTAGEVYADAFSTLERLMLDYAHPHAELIEEVDKAFSGSE